MIKYRKATIDDVDELIDVRMTFIEELDGKLEHDLKRNLENSLYDYLKSALRDDGFVAWIAEDDGVTVATSGISFYTIPPSHLNLNGKVGYILNMFTLPQYRGQGLAFKLLEKLLEEASSREVQKVSLHYTEQGYSLYKKFGFKEGHNEMFLMLNSVQTTRSKEKN